MVLNFISLGLSVIAVLIALWTLSYSRQRTVQKPNRVEHEMSEFERSTLRWTRATWAILVFTFFFIASQWYLMRSSSSDTHTLAQAANAQAKKMSNVSDAADKIRQAAQDMVAQDQRIADNAQRSLNSTIAQFQLEQRPWLAVIVGHSFPVNGNQTVKTEATLASEGSTPAIRVQEASADFIWPQPLLYQPPTSITKRFKFIDIPPITPKGEITVSNEERVASLPEWPDVEKGTKIFYFVGEVRYQDIFGKRHSTQFCLYRADPADQVLSYCRGFDRMD